MSPTKRNKQKVKTNNTPANLTLSAVISVSTLAGLLAYNSGASLEGAIARVLVVLLVCTLLGYVLNVVIWLGGPNKRSQDTYGTLPGQDPTVGTRLDLSTDDDAEPGVPLKTAASTSARQ
jgi:hypothetical protein